jgi:hypothetical protein
MTGRWRVRAGLVLAAVSGIGALLLASSPPTFPSWIAHLAALELSLLIAGAAARVITGAPVRPRLLLVPKP